MNRQGSLIKHCLLELFRCFRASYGAKSGSLQSAEACENAMDKDYIALAILLHLSVNV